MTPKKVGWTYTLPILVIPSKKTKKMTFFVKLQKICGSSHLHFQVVWWRLKILDGIYHYQETNHSHVNEYVSVYWVGIYRYPCIKCNINPFFSPPDCLLLQWYIVSCLDLDPGVCRLICYNSTVLCLHDPHSPSLLPPLQ